MLKPLQPIKEKQSYYKIIEHEIKKMLDDIIYKPVMAILESSDFENEIKISAVISALKQGTIAYNDDYFTGQFNSKLGLELRRIGATYNKLRKAYFLPQAQAPLNVKTAAMRSNQELLDKVNKITRHLDSLQKTGSVPPVNFSTQFSGILIDIDKQINTAMPSNINIPMTLTPFMRESIKREYTENLNLYIQDYTKEATVRLREKVQDNLSQGYRANRLADIIKADKGMSDRKAIFLARQETSLLISKYKEERYKDAGVNEYIWSTSHDSRVRHDHKLLEGRKFKWSEPPITDKDTGSRNNPGEDFNCLPFDSNINLAYGIEKCFRRWYTGELTTIVTDSGKTIRATPNHQVLTLRGWKAIGLLNNTDYIIDLSQELIKSNKDNINNSKSFVGDIFNSFSNNFPILKTNGTREQFHGDGSNSDVNIIRPTRILTDRLYTILIKIRNKLTFSFTNTFTFLIGNFYHNIRNSFFDFFSPLSIGCLSNRFSFFFGSPIKTNNISFRTISDNATCLNQSRQDDVSIYSSPLRDRDQTLPIIVRFNDWFHINLERIWRRSSKPSIGFYSRSSQVLRDIISCKADDLRDFCQRHSTIQKFDRVINVSRENFVGHVYNLETVNNWYCVDGIIIHNCRCVAIPLLQTDKYIKKDKNKSGGFNYEIES